MKQMRPDQMIKKNKTIIKEGLIYKIPLIGCGYALGVVARSSTATGTVLSYFFGPRLTDMEIYDRIKNITPETAIAIARHSSFALQRGQWPIIGEMENWERERWTIPLFIRRSLLDETAFLIEYDDLDGMREVKATRCDPKTEAPTDAVWGSNNTVARLSTIV